jgi:hypothetical protein
MVERGYYFSMFSRIGLCVITCKCEDFFFEANGICFFFSYAECKKISMCNNDFQTCSWTLLVNFVGLAYQGKDIVFRFIIEYSSLKDFGPEV